MRIRIKEAAQKFKQWSLYRLAAEMGKPHQTICSWANQRTQPDYDNMDALCKILGCTMDDLYTAETPGRGYF